jgi:hypothetical protein
MEFSKGLISIECVYRKCSKYKYKRIKLYWRKITEVITEEIDLVVFLMMTSVLKTIFIKEPKHNKGIGL